MEKEKALWIYRKMNEIREFEDEVHRIFLTGTIPGFVHLYAGEEAIAVGACAELNDADYITSTHRGHGHAIAKDCDILGMMAEIYGRKDGLNKGKGGSMHIAEVEKGILGANGIVGAGFPLANGAGLSIKTLKQDAVAVCFFGDGASNEGTFHEGLNFASILNLPVIFICENNGFGEATPHSYASASDTVAERASAYNMPGHHVDGKDVVAVNDIMIDAVKRAKAGEGPTLIECKTYRNYGHFEGDAQSYKSDKDELRDLDPIVIFKERALKEKWMTEEEAKQIENEVKALIKKAVEFAENSPLPDESSLLEDVYAD